MIVNVREWQVQLTTIVNKTGSNTNTKKLKQKKTTLVALGFCSRDLQAILINLQFISVTVYFNIWLEQSKLMDFFIN